MNIRHALNLASTALAFLASHAAAVAQGNIAARSAAGTHDISGVDITCESCNQIKFDDWCQSEGGGMGSNPDGTTTCHFADRLPRDRIGGLTLRDRRQTTSDAAVYTCSGDAETCATGFADHCMASDGGPSQNPDGTVTCTIH
ncbi:MAG: hypothetical protein R3C70_06295 [Geminicoccaceae bacterium]